MNEGNINPTYSCTSRIHDMSYADWTGKFWSFVHSIPKRNNPSESDSCRNCTVHQTDPNVWFLTGSQKQGHVQRTCVIQPRRKILFPVVNEDCSYAQFPNLKTDSELLNYAKNQIDTVDQKSMKVTIDDKPLDSSKICRLSSICTVRFVRGGHL
jgi:hypothetical protein